MVRWRLYHQLSRSTFNCYVLLLWVFYVHKYRHIFWRRQELFGGQHEQAQMGQSDATSPNHVFIYNSFLFDKRPNASTSAGAVKLVVLFLAERTAGLQRPGQMHCMVYSNSLPVRRLSPRLEQINSLGVCALDLFVLTCTLDRLPTDSALFDEGNGNNQYAVILREEGQFGAKGRYRVGLQPSRPSYKRRGMVMCMSRVFAYERWQLFITAMETYRLLKVDLVVTHVQSALSGVLALMRAYEREGLLSIRPGIHFPHHRDMKWDPNAETEFNGQILLAHECFYEFRQSANFIALIDWDDLLVPSAHFSSLPAAFSAATAAHPDPAHQPAYFLVNKLEASFVEQTTDSGAFSLQKLLADGIRTAPMYNDEKMVVRPSMVRGFWMHNSEFMEPHGKKVQLLTNYSVLLHLANDERVNPHEYTTPFMRRFNISAMDLHASELLEKLRKTSKEVPPALPRVHPYYDAIAECHSSIFAYYKGSAPGQAKCLSYSLCDLPSDLGVRCTSTRSTFTTLRTSTARQVVHVRRNSYFVELPKGCVHADGI